MAVSAGEAFVTFASELAPCLAFAFAVWPADIRGDVTDPFWCAVGSHCNSAAVNDCGKETHKQGDPRLPNPRNTLNFALISVLIIASRL